jgi:hypothetical protein
MRMGSRSVFALVLVSTLAACGDKNDPLDGVSSGATAATAGSGNATNSGTNNTGNTSVSSTSPGTDGTDGTDSGTDGTGTNPTTGVSASGPGTGDPSGDPSGDPPSGSYCQETCQDDGDCLVAGQDSGYTCDQGHCAGGVSGNCGDDYDCQVLLSGWQMPCFGQTDCPNQFCIDIGGGDGRCAYGPNDFIQCEALMQSEIEMPAIEGGTITVCANVDYSCIDSYCQKLCQGDGDCLTPGLPHCNVGTGRCECTSDADCASYPVAGFTSCQTTFCGCGSDDACLEYGGDVCNGDGLCGCSSVEACTTKVFDGTQQVCEPL